MEMKHIESRLLEKVEPVLVESCKLNAFLCIIVTVVVVWTSLIQLQS